MRAARAASKRKLYDSSEEETIDEDPNGPTNSDLGHELGQQQQQQQLLQRGSVDLCLVPIASVVAATAAVGTGVVVHGDPEPVEAQGCTEGSAGGPGRDKIDAIRHPQDREREREENGKADRRGRNWGPKR